MTSTSTETEPMKIEEKVDQSQARIDAGTDPIEELAPQRHHFSPPPLNETSSPPISLPEINQSEARAEPREFDPFVNDENERTDICDFESIFAQVVFWIISMLSLYHLS